MLPLNVSEVSEKGNKTQIKLCGSADSASQNASVANFLRVIHPEQHQR